MILLLVFLKGFVISLAWNSPSKTKQKVLSHVNSFWSDIYTKAKNDSEYLKLIWSGTFAICSTQPLWFWSRIGSRVKIIHYIQPSNLSSALLKLNYFFFKHNALMISPFLIADVWHQRRQSCHNRRCKNVRVFKIIDTSHWYLRIL